MTVGQLVATMRANQLSIEDAAGELDLPLVQIAEALDYYETHRELVDGELREDKERLRVKGYVVGSPAVSR